MIMYIIVLVDEDEGVLRYTELYNPVLHRHKYIKEGYHD